MCQDKPDRLVRVSLTLLEVKPRADYPRMSPMAIPEGRTPRVLYRRLRDAVLVHSPIHVGDTVRCPQSKNTGVVQRVLRHLEAAGVPWAPRALGIDEEEREVLSWVPGETASSGDETLWSKIASPSR